MPPIWLQAGNPLCSLATIPTQSACPLSPYSHILNLEHFLAHCWGWLFPEFKTIIFINRILKVI